MLALSEIFYDFVKMGKLKVDDINIPIVKKEVEELLALDKEKEQ